MSRNVFGNILMAVFGLKKNPEKKSPKKTHMLSMAVVDTCCIEEMEEKDRKISLFFQNSPQTQAIFSLGCLH